ncbi:aminopeptidase N [Dermacoccaceae bacterium W4C1]
MPGQNLSRDEATLRSSLIEVEEYQVAVDVTGDDTTFATSTEVRFTAEPGAETFIDFIGAGVGSVTLNGTALDVEQVYADDRIQLPGLAAQNTLRVEATGLYMHTGEGLHRMVDPTDDEVYLYTQFEVADARRMFPVFEQPDLKARFSFTITAPSRWQVVSNSPTPQPEPAEGTWTNPRGENEPIATWRFEPTPTISCYITALVAGPYEVVRGEAESRSGTVPLGVFCRRSLAPYLDAENLMDITRAGFTFFEETFDRPYPFAKYDQLFVPEYNAGAMENAGCVTFAEIYVFRAKVADAIVERRGLTVLHELAHMWFGDLVTMTWWDDLWLNESFAEWASTTCQAEATDWTSAWTTFSVAEKSWAYNQDQLSSTHPISADMVDLSAVHENFDGITYAKGASVLKQLVAYVGREEFVAGLRTYFAKHAWGNTQLVDLLTELEATSGRDLSAWTKAWLNTAGVNTLRAEFETDADGAFTSFAIAQSATQELPTLRPHRLAVGLYDLTDGKLVRRESIDVDIDGARTELPQLVGKQRGDLVLLNDEDLAYAKIRLDEQSLSTALANPNAFDDSLPRVLVLGAAWDMVRDAQLPASDFVELCLAALSQEKDSTVLRVLLTQLSTATAEYVAPANSDRVGEAATAGLRDLALSAEPGSDAQLQLVHAFSARAHSPADVELVRGWLTEQAPLAGLEVDTEMRWSLLTALAAAGAVDASELDAERERDATATGAERHARALASLPTPEAKEAAWKRAVLDTDTPNQTRRAVALGLLTAHDTDLLRPLVERFHADIEGVWSAMTSSTASDITGRTYPWAVADQSLADATQQWLDTHPDAPAGARRLIAEHLDRVKRALAAQACDAG